MYTDFYGLREMPFELTANPKYLYLTHRHREVLSNLQYGLAAAKGITLLLGDAGAGKTMMVKAALSSDRCRHVSSICVTNPTLMRSEFLTMLARSFGLSDAASRSKPLLLEELEKTVLERRSRGGITALIVDEAQSLTTELLEEIRLLANIESPTEKLLPLVLAGQPRLGVRLDDDELAQLKQRVTLRCEIGPFDLAETAEYIGTRIKAAGGVAFHLFTREAIVCIYEYSRGIPRTINVVCDNALLSGFALGKAVDKSIVLEVCRDLHLGDPASDRQAGAIGGASQAATDKSTTAPASQVRQATRQDEAASSRFRLFGSRL